MANKVPNFQVSQRKQTRNAFDLSQTHNFLAAPGQLLPILSLELIPDDDVTINIEDFVKSMPIVNAPLCSARGVYEFFFVPFHQIWHNYDQFITQMNDYRSNAFALPNPPTGVPTFSTVKSSDAKSNLFVGSPKYFADLFGRTSDDWHKIVDYMGSPVPLNYNYLYDLLGYGSFLKPNTTVDNVQAASASSVIQTSPNYSMNPFRLCAYNKIYEDYYRKTSYEAFNVKSYSIDSFDSSAKNPLFTGLGMHYRNYGLDLLTNLRPSASLNVNNQSVFNNILPNMFGTDMIGDSSFDYSTEPANSNNINGVVINSRDALSSGSLSLNSIRAAFAIDRLSQLIGRAEKDFQSQMKAVYGTNVTMGRDGKCIFIDGFSSDISFGEVDNTNGDSYSRSYSSYGKVFGNGNGRIHFKSPEFGVLMCIYSIIPFVPYDSYRVDSFNTKHSYTDYFNPVYQHLGLQPLYEGQISTIYNGKALTNPLGWQPRYSEYKTAIDLNHCAFNNDGSLRSFTASRTRGWTGTEGSLALLSLRNFKISPNIFDSVFTTNFDGSFASYPFMLKTSFNVVKVSSMDVDSLPLL